MCVPACAHARANFSLKNFKKFQNVEVVVVFFRNKFHFLQTLKAKKQGFYFLQTLRAKKQGFYFLQTLKAKKQGFHFLQTSRWGPHRVGPAGACGPRGLLKESIV